MQRAYQNAKKQRFWRSESLHFAGDACLRTPYLIKHQKVILPHQNKKLLRINKPIYVLTNQLKTTWPSSLGIPSNVVNILYKNNYVCYFLKLPKSLLRFSFFNKTPLHRQLKLYRQCLFSTYMAIQKVYLIYVLSIGSFFLHPFFWRRGGGEECHLN